MEYKEVLLYLLGLIQMTLAYIFLSHKTNIEKDIQKLENKIEKIETGEFVEKIVKNVIYSPESRQYFKSIFSEALEHKGKNNDSISIAILDHIKEIEDKLDRNDKQVR